MPELTLYDLFTGHFTVAQILRDIAPVLLATSSAFFAGYWVGRNREFNEWVKRTKKGPNA